MEVSGQLHTPAALPKEKSPGTHWKGGSVGPRIGLEDEEEVDLLLRKGINKLFSGCRPRGPVATPAPTQSGKTFFENLQIAVILTNVSSCFPQFVR